MSMKLLIQCVDHASVTIDNSLYSKIGRGYLVFVSFTFGDNEEIMEKMITKLLNLRVFQDENGKTNLSLKDVNGEILSVSQFTLYANMKHGNRPSFTDCLTPSVAKDLYSKFNLRIKELGYSLKEGVFGADMKVELINDGPFTIILDSKEILK